MVIAHCHIIAIAIAVPRHRHFQGIITVNITPTSTPLRSPLSLR
jgi:hypothetical protein